MAMTIDAVIAGQALPLRRRWLPPACLIRSGAKNSQPLNDGWLLARCTASDFRWAGDPETQCHNDGISDGARPELKEH